MAQFKKMIKNNGKVLTLVAQNSEGKLEVCAETLRHVKEYNGHKFGFVCVCGQYRSGKSFLLNSLFLKTQGKGFETSGSTQACTKGINIWSEPLVEGDSLIWILDTEGFGSLEKDASYDGKILLLSMLLCNTLLYNSFGAIDENSISKLALVCRQAQSIDSKFADTQLFWVLRDFSLEMVDREGKPLSSDDYLEECLRQGEHGKNGSEKDLLKRLFGIRHCVPLIRPVIDEQKLHNLNELPRQQLRSQFREEIQNLSQNLASSLIPKKINGLQVDGSNIDLVMNQFVEAINSDRLDHALQSTYEKIREYQIVGQKQKIMGRLMGKIEGVKRLLPVGKDHLKYLGDELQNMIQEDVQERQQYLSKEQCQLLVYSLKEQIRSELQKVKSSNKYMVDEQIKDYLYRRTIELYPTLIALTVNTFEHRWEELMSALKSQYEHTYQQYFEDKSEFDAKFSHFMQKQIRKVFGQIVKRWKHSSKQMEEKLQQTKKQKNTIQEEFNKLREEKKKATRNLQQYRRQQGRSLSKMKLQIEQTYKEELTTIVMEYEQKIKKSTERSQTKITELQHIISKLQQQKNQLSRTTHFERRGLLEKVSLEQERADLMTIKYEQYKNTAQLQNQQLKSSYENKIKILQIKCSQSTNALNAERKKFQNLTDERMRQFTQLQAELQTKNNKIEQLTQQLERLQQKYESQMQRILTEQKEILVKTITNKIQESDYKCQVLEEQLVQNNAYLRQLQGYEARSDQLEVEVRQLRNKLQEKDDECEMSKRKIDKMEKQLSEKDKSINAMRYNYQKELDLADQKLRNHGKYLQEVEQRHRQELDHFHRKLQLQLAQQSQMLAHQHEANLRQNQALQEQKWTKQRAQLKEIISNNYQQIEQEKTKVNVVVAHIDKIYGVLTRIRNKHHNLGQTPRRQGSTFSMIDQFGDSDDLIRISESPEEDSRVEMPSGKDKAEKAECLLEEVEQIFVAMNREIHLLVEARNQLRNKLASYEDQLQEYDSLVSKARTGNREFKYQVEQLRKKQKGRQRASEAQRQNKEKMDRLQRQNYHLSKDLQLKDQANLEHERHLQQNIKMLKDTVSSLTQQNQYLTAQVRQLSAKHSEVSEELERFRIWAQMQTRRSVQIEEEEQWESGDIASSDRIQQSMSRVKELEGQLRKMVSRVQEDKLASLQRHSHKENLLSGAIIPHHMDEITKLRRQNQLLYEQLKQSHEKELKAIGDNKILRNKSNDEEANKYCTLQSQYSSYKKQAKQTINTLQSQISGYVEENRQLQKQFNDLEDNLTRKYELTLKIAQQQVVLLKEERNNLKEHYTQKIAILQEALNSRVAELERKLAGTKIEQEKQKESLEKEGRRLSLEAERHRLKYEHLLKVNNELLKQIQQLKSQAHQVTLKEKYKQKIAKLFTD